MGRPVAKVNYVATATKRRAYCCYLARQARLGDKGGNAATWGTGSSHSPLHSSVFQFEKALYRDISPLGALLFYLRKPLVRGQVDGDGDNYSVSVPLEEMGRHRWRDGLP